MCIIYEPRGKAKEYSKLAANLYKGCSHGCTYCYAPAATFTKPEQFVRNISPRKNAEFARQWHKHMMKEAIDMLMCQILLQIER